MYGCGNGKCKPCYPFTYGCEYCGGRFQIPIANGEVFVCDSCGYVTDEQSDEIKFADLI